MILVDTSAWIEFDRASGSRTHLRVRSLIADTDEVAVTEPVIMEVMAGARTLNRERDLRRLMGRFHLLPFRPASHFLGACTIYRRCRARGITPRGMLDCMIAAVAQSEGVALLAQDADMNKIAEVISLQLDRT
ncbi:type II toxin-antitoxin system toxin ribonuclease VapC11 [soil metagenome]